MIRALIVAYHFPPIGGGGVQRASKFARYLSEFGVEPIILTGPGPVDGRWTPHDPTMLADVHPDAIRRAAGPVPSGGMLSSVHRGLAVPNAFSKWWIDSIVREGRRIEDPIDVILGELVPYETAYGVERLARELGVPWVADLQDPWALDEMWLYPTGLHRSIDRARMRRTLGTAAAVVMNTPEARSRLIAAFPEFGSRRVQSITNGYDAKDFAGAAPARTSDAFSIVHSGYLYTDFGTRSQLKERLRCAAGGMPVPGVDFLTRSHAYLLKAVDKALIRDPALRGSLEIHFVGEVTGRDRELAEPYPFVVFHGYRPHAESISLLRSADLLFLPMQDLPPGVRAGLVPGKTYEYMASGTPILAAVPDGDARDMLLEIGNASVCRPTDVECMADRILEAVEHWRAGTPVPPPDEALLARVERRSLTEEMGALLREVAGTGNAPSVSAAKGGLASGDLNALLYAPRPPRWRRAVHRLSAPVMSPLASRELNGRVASAKDVNEVVQLVFEFSYWGVEIGPLQLPSELARLLDYVREQRPRTVLEIGTAGGGTFCGFAAFAAADALLVSVDLRHGEFGGGYPSWRAPLYRSFATRDQRISLIEGDSHSEESLAAVTEALGGRLVDLLFIDGDHTYPGVKADFETYSKLVAPDGLIALHDIAPEKPSAYPGMRVCVGGVPEFWREIRDQYEHVEIVDDWEQGAFGIGMIRWPGVKPVGSRPHESS